MRREQWWVSRRGWEVSNVTDATDWSGNIYINVKSRLGALSFDTSCKTGNLCIRQRALQPRADEGKELLKATVGQCADWIKARGIWIKVASTIQGGSDYLSPVKYEMKQVSP